MHRTGMKYELFFAIYIPAFFLAACIDPYYPKLDKYQSLLIVDALLTDDETSCSVRLSRTTSLPDETPPGITGAIISLSDNLGNNAMLHEIAEGIYKTSQGDFRGMAGREYRLSIYTPDGKEYESDPCILKDGSTIDTVYFSREIQVTDSGEVQEGIRIYIDAGGSSENEYCRLTYEEWWKFTVPHPVTHRYVDEYHIYDIPVENATCYGHKKSNEVIIQLHNSEENEGFIKSPVCFIASGKTNRLLLQYYIEVTRYTLSEKEYQFWRLMKEINESGGDIFDRQPFTVTSNIHCVSDPGEKVLGYFQVCGADKKRICIRGSEIEALALPPYQYACEMIVKGPQDYPPSEKPVTFDRIYQMYTMQGYNFVAPQYAGYLDRLVFVDPYCSDCTSSGSLEKPDFWVDLE